MIQMNYISQLKAFHELRLKNPLSIKAIGLYSVLLDINNGLFWRERFTVANSTIILSTGMNKKTFDRVRNELIQKNYIEYKKGRGNQAGEYKIIKLYDDLLVQNDTQNVPQNLKVQNDTQIVPQNDTQIVAQSVNINKTENSIFFNLLNKARDQMENTSYSSKLHATTWAKNQAEWNQLTSEEQFKFIASL